MNNLNKLKKLAAIVNFKEEEHIFFEGDRSNSFYIILKGSVSIYRTNTYDDSKVELVKLGESSIFGEMAVLSHDVRSASVMATTDCICLEFPSYNFEEFISIEPKYAINFITTLVNRKSDINSKVENQGVVFNAK